MVHGGVRTAGCRRGRRGRLATLLPRLLLVAVAALLLLLPIAAGAQQRGDARALRDAGVEVVFWPGHETLARRTLEAAVRPQRLPGIPADSALTAGTIYLAPSPAIFDSLTGGRVPEWGAGVAIPALRMIVLPTYPAPGPAVREPAITLRHEIAHLEVHAYLPAPIPRWFDEGYATWTSGGWDQSSAWQIRLAFLLGRAPPLDSLNLEWPRDAERARFAYLLSASAVQYLIEIGGEDGFTALLSAWREQGTFDAALRRVYGMTPGQFERDWRSMVKRRYGWLLAFSQVTVLWGLGAVLLVVLWRIRRRRNRERLDLLEREERSYPPPDAAEYMGESPPEVFADPPAGDPDLGPPPERLPSRNGPVPPAGPRADDPAGRPEGDAHAGHRTGNADRPQG
jgi:hypothetical protein